MDGWHLERLFSVASGIAFIVYGLINLGAPVPLYLLLLALLLSIVGSQAVIFVLTLTGAVTINTLGAGIMQNGWSLIEFSKYPTNIFLQPFRFLFLRLIPLALMGYLPAGLIFGKVTAVDILASLLGLWFFGFVSLKYWNRSIKAYEGVGA
jgi:ABC-2 type transport system permease protein